MCITKKELTFMDASQIYGWDKKIYASFSEV